MSEYEINIDTQAIIPLGPEKSKVIEGNKVFIVEQPALKIIDKSCRFFGSSYQGRFLGTKNLIGISHKAPIIIEETREIIFFPTNSPRQNNCAWISLKHVENYKKSNNNFAKILALVFCVIIFIIISAEHCIANIGYFILAKSFTLKGFLYFLLMVLGNSIGGLLIPSFTKLIKLLNEKKDEA